MTLEKVKEALEYYAKGGDFDGDSCPSIAQEALTELSAYIARLESSGRKEALAYFMEAEHLKRRFGDGVAIDSLIAQGYAKGETTLCSTNT